MGIFAWLATSISLQIFLAWAEPSEPPRMAKSWAKTATSRSRILPKPAMTPSPGKRFSSRPKPVARLSRSRSISWKLSSSSR